MVMPADRLTTLEIRFSEQEKVVDELSSQLALQWSEIERMKKALEQLALRYQAIEERTASEIPTTRPPHW